LFQENYVTFFLVIDDEDSDLVTVGSTVTAVVTLNRKSMDVSILFSLANPLHYYVYV